MYYSLLLYLPSCSQKGLQNNSLQIMVKDLLLHQWLQFRRSASFERELGITIFIWIMSGIALLSLLSLAFVLPKIVNKIPGVVDPIFFINQVVVYYLLGEFLLRYFLQHVPTLAIEPYLNLPIKRQNVALFLVSKSLLSPFNILAVALLFPFTKEIIVSQVGSIAAYTWLASVFFLSLCLHFFNILFKKKLEDIPLVWVIIIVLAASNYFLSDYYNIDLFKPAAQLLHTIVHQPILITIPLLSVTLLCFTTIKFFTNNLYLEELTTQQKASVENYTGKLEFLERSTITNALLFQEIKMIIRHKRTRSATILSLILLGYGLLFFGRGSFNMSMFLFFGIFMSGSFAINYGQFFWSWNTNQLDFFFTKPIALKTWINSRYNLLAGSCIVTSLLCIPYVYFGWDILFLLLATALYNLGINIPLMMRLSLWDPKPIDLNKGSMMNYQGTGSAQWVMGIPMLLGPFIVYIPTKLLLNHHIGLIAIALVGLAGFTFRDVMLNQITKKAYSLKYKLINNLTL